ncbi:MAG TPA: hypothetical protein VFI31_07055 [Pirellulales bacterium]|nr:hypothetical protein [Pirellulales bacterium]
MARVRRKTSSAATALAGFAITMLVLPLAIGWWSGPPRSAALEAKWDAFASRADEFDVVFIGTSHVERHIDPRVVDRTLFELGSELRSYNFGLPKMSMLEGAELIERISRLRPRRLKLVVLEPTLYLYDADNWSTDRAMAEHDWQGTMLAARLTWASETRRQSTVWGKLKCITPHVLSFVCRSFGLRSADRLLDDANCETPQSAFFQAGRCDPLPPLDAAAGFRPLPVNDHAADASGWRERFARFMEFEPDWSGVSLSDVELAYFDCLLERIRQIGAEPVLLLGPKVKRDSHTAAVYTSHRQHCIDAALIDHLRGHSDTDLYQLPYWHDFDHLNADGAALFSRQLAVELARLLDLPCAFVTEADFPQPQTCRIIPER